MKTMKIFTLFVAVFILQLSAQSQNLTLGNKVWWDVNDNGKRDAGESGMSGVTVRLYQDNDNNGIADGGFAPLTTTTNSFGTYNFTNLLAGSYFVVVEAGWSHYSSTVYGGDPDNNTDNDNNGYSQNLATFEIKGETITLTPGSETDATGATNTNTNSTYDIACWKDNGLGDFVWLDSDANGIQDSGEPGLAGVVVNLRNSSGTLLATTITDADGRYYFHDPVAYGTNEYQVEFVTPSGYRATSSKKGGNNNKDSDPVNGIVTGVIVPNGKWDHSIDAGFIPEGTIILPVKLTSFAATADNHKKVNLTWSTASEVNFSHFVVEKSYDGVNFTEGGLVFASGNSNDNLNYSFADNLSGVNVVVVFYRLRMVDIDGKAKYSEVRVIRLATQNANAAVVTVFPNPAVNDLRVTVPSSWQGKKVQYEIFGSNGVLIMKQEQQNSSQTETFDVRSLSKGVYVLRVICNNEVSSQRFVKQ